MPLFRKRSRRGRVSEAREWLLADERRQVIGLVILSITVSITLSLLVTAIVGTVSRRRATRVIQPEAALAPAEPPPGAEDVAAGVAVMDVPASASEAPVEA